MSTAYLKLLEGHLNHSLFGVKIYPLEIMSYYYSIKLGNWVICFEKTPTIMNLKFCPFRTVLIADLNLVICNCIL